MLRKALALPLLLVPIACKAPRPPSPDPRAACPSLDARACLDARALVAAAPSYDDLARDFVVDDPARAPLGRGLVREASGPWTVLPDRCAVRAPGAPESPASIDATTIDHASIGITVDGAWISSDADLAPLIADTHRPHTVSLVAVAFVRDRSPAILEASPAVRPVSASSVYCTCGAAPATHFAGAARSGGILAYSAEARAGDSHGTALDFFRAALSDPHARITVTRKGGLALGALDAVLKGGATRLPTFAVKTPVAIATPVHPLSDVCGLALPEPDVSPLPMDFGDATYGTASTRTLHVVNRAAIDLKAILGARTFAIPPRGAIDLPLTWSPSGDALGCEIQSREEVVLFMPADPDLAVSPKLQQAHVVERVRTGPPRMERAERIDSGDPRRPKYDATTRDWTCPRDFVVAACRTENARCASTAGTCASDGYVLTSAPSGNGCHFGCAGPASTRAPQFCRFDARMECQLACSN